MGANKEVGRFILSRVGWYDERMNQQQEQVVAQLAAAFDGVTLGNGVGLWQAQEIDAYSSAEAIAAARKRDEKSDWRKLAAEDLNTCYSSLSFFDAEGMRFHLPAFLLAELRGGFRFSVVFTLVSGSDYSDRQFSALSGAQRNAVRGWLEHVAEKDGYADDFDEILRSLEARWLYNP